MSKKCRSHCMAPCQASLSPCFGVETDTRGTLHLLRELCPGRLMIRQAGLTLLQQTNLATDESRTSDFIHFEEEVIDSLQVILFQCPTSNCLRAALLNKEDQIVSHLIIDAVPWNSEEANLLRSQLQLQRVTSNHCFSHCKRWLDDWSDESPVHRKRSNLEVIKSLITFCLSLRISVNRAEFHLESKLQPSFIDQDDGILRIADRRQNHVLFADLNLLDFKFQENSLLISC